MNGRYECYPWEAEGDSPDRIVNTEILKVQFTLNANTEPCMETRSTTVIVQVASMLK